MELPVLAVPAFFYPCALGEPQKPFRGAKVPGEELVLI
jgi:hypothetical protein